MENITKFNLVKKKNYSTKLTYNNFYSYFLLALPALLFFLIFFAGPVASSLYFSFTDFNGISLKTNFVGLRNYSFLFKDTAFFMSILNTVIFAIVLVIFQNGLGLLAALGLTQPIKSTNILRTLIFMPCLISSVVVGFTWSFIYEINGPLNILLREIGLGNLARSWLGLPETALGAIILATVWKYMGRTALLYITNIKAIPNDIMEAAAIDGAKGFVKFKHIIFPLLAPATTVNVITSFIGSLMAFDIIYIMTRGGPGHYTETMGTYIVKLIRDNYNGYAASVSVFMILFILFINYFVFRKLTAREVSM